MKTLISSALLEKSPLKELKEKMDANRDSHSDSRFYSYSIQGGILHLEVTASQTMESITQLEVEDQAKFFQAIAEEVPNPGDYIVIVDDDQRQQNKRRSACVVRLRPDKQDEVRLLITR